MMGIRGEKKLEGNGIQRLAGVNSARERFSGTLMGLWVWCGIMMVGDMGVEAIHGGTFPLRALNPTSLILV